MNFKRFKFPKNKKSRSVFIASIILGVAVVFVFCLETYSSYRTEIRSAEIQSANLSQVLEEQMLSSFKKIDLALQDLQDAFSRRDASHRQIKDMTAFLMVHRDRLPEVFSLKFFNADGDLTINDDDSPKFNISDRYFFRYFKETKKDVLIISPPIQGRGRATSLQIIVLTRPVLSEKNEFLGIVAAAVPVQYYQDIFSKINVGKFGSIALFGFDSILYSRVPSGSKLIGTKISLSKTSKSFIKSNREVDKYRSFSTLDGYEKVYSIRKIGKFPLFFAVGLSIQETLMAWKTRTIIYIVFLSVLFISFSFLLLIFIRSIEMLQEQRKFAIQSAKLTTLGEMASNIAHEINNPLTVISTLAMISKLPGPLDQNGTRINSNLDKIMQTVDRIAKIIQSLRTFSRDSYNDPILPTSIQSILNTTFELCLQRLKNNNIEVSVDPFEERFINCREHQIVQVLMNLLNNSLDALDGQKNKFIKIKIHDAGKNVRIMVQDNGPKISDEVVEKMMNPFFTTKEMGKGTGLGLSISKGIIENLNGEFYFDKNQELTTFVIEIPKA